MRLNNKGFAISSTLYIILVLAIILIVLSLSVFSSRSLVIEKIKNEAMDNIYNMPYKVVLKTLKSEIIQVAINNNIEEGIIKIGDLNSSVPIDTLNYHKLTEKSLTFIKNDDNYEVYLEDKQI